MDYAVLSVNGEDPRDRMIETDDDVSIRLEFDASEYTLRCGPCGAALNEDGTDDNGETECPDGEETYTHDDDEYPDCGPDCAMDGTTDAVTGETVPYSGDNPDHYLNVTRAAHEPEPMPLSWVNSAGIHTDADGDSVTVTISVGDPRGAFAFTVRRVTPDDGEPYLVMHTPYPGEGLPHMPLTRISDGTYRIGH